MPDITLTFSQTANFSDRPLAQSAQSTKTVTWTLRSNSPMQTGTFLDGTPWVVDNGDINLIATTPVSEKKVVQHALVVGGNWTLVPFEVDINNTVINPDLGKAKRNNDNNTPANKTNDILKIEPITGSRTQQDLHIYPFDGRGGKRRVSGADSIIFLGTSYDPTQKWNPQQPTRLGAGDQVVVVMSRYFSAEDVFNNEGLQTGFLDASGNVVSQISRSAFRGVSGVIDGVAPYPVKNTEVQLEGPTDCPPIMMYGALTVVQTAPLPNSYRPPCNWDPTDRINAPILTEDLEIVSILNAGLEVPNYTIDSNVVPPTSTPYLNYISNNNAHDYYDPFLWVISPSRQNNEVRGFKYTSCYGPVGSFSTPSDYGGFHARATDYKHSIIMDPTTDIEIKNKMRATVVQRGIDLFGAMYSLGKTINPDGGHPEDFMGYMQLAYLVTKDRRIFDMLNNDYVGNTANGTYLNLKRDGFVEFPYMQDLTQAQFYPTNQPKEAYCHAARFNGLTVKEVYQGTSPAYGPYQAIRVAAPGPEYGGLGLPILRRANINASATATGLTGYWTRDTLYNRSPNDRSGPGNWNLSNNRANASSEQMVGGLVRINGSNAKINRIIYDIPLDVTESALVNGHPLASTATDNDRVTWADRLLFLQNDMVVSAGDKVDICSHLENDFDDEVMFRATTLGESMNMAYPYGFLPYGSFMDTYLVPNKFYHDIAKSRNIEIPYYLDHAVRKGKWFARNGLHLATIVSNFNSAYDLWGIDWYRAWFRKLYGNDTEPLPYPNGNGRGPGPHDVFSSYASQGYLGVSWYPRRSGWVNYPLPTNAKWLETYPPPPNITAATSMAQANNPVNVTEEGKTELCGKLKRCQFLAHPDSINHPHKLVLFMSSDANNSLSLSYSTYLQGKRAYIWIAGRTRPIMMNLLSENKTSDSDTTWNQQWEFPAGKNSLQDFVEYFGGSHIVRVFFADYDNKYEESYIQSNTSSIRTIVSGSPTSTT